MDLKDIFEILPDIVLYISAGYIFVFTFSFTSLRKKVNDIQGSFVVSLTVGFILKAVICAILPVRFSFYVNIVGFLIICAILGIVIGFIIESKHFRKLLIKLDIRKSVHENIWHEIMDSDKKTMWIRAVSIEKNQVIIGVLISIEEFERYPLLLLQQYKTYDLNGNLLEDYSDYANHQILIKSESYDTIDVVYDENSSHYRKIEIEGEEECPE